MLWTSSNKPSQNSLFEDGENAKQLTIDTLVVALSK
jgi:hypothetical protein